MKNVHGTRFGDWEKETRLKVGKGDKVESWKSEQV